MMESNPVDLYTSLGSDPESGDALAAERARITDELDLLKHTKTTQPREDVTTYRRFLKARLRAIRQAQKALCRTCLGTGHYEDIHLTYRTCPKCERLNPNQDGTY
jgi:hypothetical protein